MGEVSLALKFSENMSSAIVSLKNQVAGFQRDLTGLTGQLGSLSAKKVDIKTNMTAVTRELSEAKKVFRATGDEAALLTVKAKEADLSQLRDELSLVSKQASETQKQINSCDDAISKADNRAGARGAGGGKGGGSLAGQLGSAGLYAMAGQAASQMANTFVGSAFGEESGALFASALSQAGAGAAIGSMIAPGIGTAIGAVAGGAIGLASGAAQNFEKKDSAFKNYAQNQYDTVTGEQQQSLITGSQIAGGRETDQISFATLFGDAETAQSYLANLTDMANRTPFQYADLTRMSKTLATYGYGADSIMPVLQTVGDTGAALGMGAEDMTMVSTALGRMKSSDKTTLEYLNILNDRGVGAVGMLSDSYGVDQGTMYDMISKGQVSGKKAADIILGALTDSFSGAMEAQSQTFGGLSSTAEGLQGELDNAMGEGYNKERSAGLQAEIDWLGSDNGGKMKEAYDALGAWKADLENQKEEFVRTSVSTAMNSIEYRRADIEGDAAEMGRIIAEAKAEGINKYNAGPGAQEALASEKSLAQSLQENAAAQESYWSAGYEMGQQFTKGVAASMLADSGVSAAGAKSARQNARNAEVTRRGGNTAVSGFAVGLERVPYDNFPALLHQGERVLTAREVRSAPQQGGGGVVVTGNEFNIRQESDIDAIASALLDRIRLAKLAGVTG